MQVEFTKMDGGPLSSYHRNQILKRNSALIDVDSRTACGAFCRLPDVCYPNCLLRKAQLSKKMEANIIPRNPVTGKAAYDALAPFTKREFRFAMVTGAVFGAAWKAFHWSAKRDMTNMNKTRIARLKAQQKRYDDALSAEMNRLGL